MSKGSRPRPYSVAQQEYDNRWDAIFGRDLENTQPTPEPQQKAQDETTLGRTVPPQHN
jgi:hypothetical protein